MMKFVATLLLLLSLVPAVYANKTKPRPKTASSTVEERETMSRLHVTYQKGIHAGALAVERGQADDIRAFARHLVEDHSTADAKLVALAQKNEVSLPEMESSALDLLRSAKESDFNRVFTGMMVREHEQALKLVHGAQGTAKDTELLAFLKDTLPMLEKHRDTAEKLQSPARAEVPVLRH